MKSSFEHVIPAPVDKVIAAHGSEEYYVEKQKNFGALTVDVEKWETGSDGVVTTKAKVTEPSKLPSFIRKGDVDEYVEEAVLDPDAKTFSWKVTPKMSPDKFFLSGKVEFRDEGDQTRVVFNTEFTAKIPIIGKKVEKYAAGRIEEESKKQAEFLKAWLAK